MAYRSAVSAFPLVPLVPIDRYFTHCHRLLIFAVYKWYTNRLTTFHWNRFVPMVPVAPIDKATLTYGNQSTNGRIGEGVLTIGICLCVLDISVEGLPYPVGKFTKTSSP